MLHDTITSIITRNSNTSNTHNWLKVWTRQVYTEISHQQQNLQKKPNITAGTSPLNIYN